MAKRIVDEEMRFNIVINGDSAQKELIDLEKQTKKLSDTNKDLRAQKQKLAAQGKKNTQEYKNLTAEIKANNTTIAANKSKMQVLQNQIGVTGLTMSQLRKKASLLRLQLNNMIPGSAQYKKLQADLQAVNTQITKLSLKSRAAQSTLSSMAEGFNKYAVLATSVIAAGTGVVLTMQKMIDFNGKLSDAQSNVEKTTGLTNAQVVELTKSFGLLKTRSTRIELLRLAEDAGRLGIEGSDNIKAFVAQANKLKVALGDDLNDVQIKSVGKMVEVYEIGAKTGKSYADSLDALGSAINEVSASGSNEAGFLVDYMARLGGVSKNAKIAASDNLGYAATFNELELQVETSATAMNKIWSDMFKNTKFYADIAGVGVKDFSKLLESDANAAMIKFLKGLNNGNAGFGSMLEKMEELDAGGSRGETALLSLAAATDKLEQRQKTAKKALEESTSLTNEYNIKNNNLAATIEKVQKKLRGMYSSAILSEGLNDFVVWIGKFIGAVDDADGKVTTWRNRFIALVKAIIIVTTAIISYKTAVQLAALWTGTLNKTTKLYILTQKLAAAASTAMRVATLLMSGVFNLLTLNITRARAAWALLNAQMLLSPIGLVAAGITALIGAYYLFSDATEDANKSQTLLNNALSKATEATAADIKQKELWLKTARDENASRADKQKAIDELNRSVPEYNNNLTIETINNEAATKSLNLHIDALKRNAVAHALLEEIKAKAVEMAKIERSTTEDNVKWYEALWQTAKAGNSPLGAQLNIQKAGTKNKLESIEATKEEIKILEELYATQLKKNSNASGNSNTPTAPKEGERKTIGDKTFVYKNGKWVLINAYTPKGPLDNTAVNQKKKEAAALLQLQRETEDNRLALLQDGFEKENALEIENFNRKIEDLKIKQAEYNEAYDLAVNKGDSELASILLQKSQEVDKQIEQSKELHYNKMQNILSESISENINALTKKHEQEEQLIEINQNNQLAALGSNLEARKKLEEQFKTEALEREKEHQENLKKELLKVLDTVSKMEQFNVEILTEEQKEVIIARLEALGLKISQINALLAKMSGKGETENGLDFGLGGAVDILGMSGEQWEQMFANTENLEQGIGKVVTAVGAAIEAYKIFSDYQTAAENKRFKAFEQNTNQEKAKLKKLYDNKFLTQQQYEKGVKKLDEETDKRKEELEYKQAKRAWKLQLTQAIANTAMAVLNGLQATPFLPVGIAMGALAGILGGIQIATIAKNKPVRGYESGFYNSMPVQREQDGKMFNAAFGGESKSGIVNKPTVFLAGEGGKNFPEMIIDGRTLSRFNPELKSSLYREISKVKGFENGYYKDNEYQVPANSEKDIMLISVLSRAVNVLEQLEENGVIAHMSRDFNDIRLLRDRIDELKKVENKSIIN